MRKQNVFLEAYLLIPNPAKNTVPGYLLIPGLIYARNGERYQRRGCFGYLEAKSPGYLQSKVGSTQFLYRQPTCCDHHFLSEQVLIFPILINHNLKPLLAGIYHYNVFNQYNLFNLYPEPYLLPQNGT